MNVLVLGGGSDIARALLERLRREGPVSAVRAVRVPRAASDDGDVWMRFDALDRASHPAFVEDAFARLGKVDLVLVAFGILGDQLQDETDAEAAVEVIEVNFVGAVSVLVLIAERLRRQGHGAIVVLSSVAAERPRRENFLYGSSKAGLDAFAQGLGDAVAGSGVHVLVVRPGFVHTKMTAGRTPVPFATSPTAVAEAIARGLQSGAHTVWVPAYLRHVMSALRHLPRPLFRRLRG